MFDEVSARNVCFPRCGGNCGLFLSGGMDTMERGERRRKRRVGETEQGRNIHGELAVKHSHCVSVIPGYIRQIYSTT